MSEKEKPQNVIESYRKRQERAQRAPTIIFSVAAIILIVGAAYLIFWLTSEDGKLPTIKLPMFADTATPTSTNTITPSPVPPTATPTHTPTEIPPTDTPEPTNTPTLSGPVIYTAEEGDNLYSIAEKFGVDILVLIEVNRDRLELDPANPVIRVGDQVLIPGPDTELPTPTPLPAGLPRGYKIEYMVKSGDTLELIAARFNSTVEDILETNEDLDDPNAIYIGQVLTIRINLVTAVPTEEGTPPPASTPGSIFTLTPEPTATPEE
jgi:LysM repeat protein